jgi:hypothetical protein
MYRFLKEELFYSRSARGQTFMKETEWRNCHCQMFPRYRWQANARNRSKQPGRIHISMWQWSVTQVRTFNHSLKLNFSLRNRTSFLYSQQPAYILKALCNQPFLHDGQLRNYSSKHGSVPNRPTPSLINKTLHTLLRRGQHFYLTWVLFGSSTLILAYLNNFVN